MIGTRLPIGIQSFSALRAGEYAYVDKTAYISRLVRRGKYFFLARPRRFGKSLFVDTLACAFEGRRELFDGLYLDVDKSWDWSGKHTVLRIDWSIAVPRSPEALRVRISEILSGWEKEFDIERSSSSPGGRLFDLVKGIAVSTRTDIIVLVDEYDKPILDAIDNPSLAGEMRDVLRDFYTTLKPLDPYLGFVFLTGVSKFSKTGIFSGLINLEDITLDSRYSAICGYTQEDLESVFADRLCAFDREDVRRWYNGYGWMGESVYNPFDILLLFSTGIFKAHWFETGTPTFLVKLLVEKARTLPDFEDYPVSEEMLGSFDPENIRPETLLFQAGYLTIKAWTSDAERGVRYRLGFLNQEVRTAFSVLMLGTLTGRENALSASDMLYDAMISGDSAAVRTRLCSVFASIPYEWYRKNRLSSYEGYYASIVYACFAGLGFDVIPEDTTNRGRIDLSVRTRTSVWIFEFKVKSLDRSGDKDPLQQIISRGYAKKYADSRDKAGKVLPIRLVGIVFDPETRTIDSWEES
jgi:hypothetical protein